MKTRQNVYVITGGTGGMGLAIAKRMADKGNLLLADLFTDRLAETKKQYQAQNCLIETMVCDTTNKDQVQALAAKAKNMGKLAGLIHTAGLSPSLGTAERIVQVNAVGTALVLDAFYELAEPGTVVIVIASNNGHLPLVPPPDPELEVLLQNPLADNFLKAMERFVEGDVNAAYAFSKYGNIMLVEKQANQWSLKGARIISISPGLIMTPMGEKEASNPQTSEFLHYVMPNFQYGVADDIAAPVEFLLSPGAAHINGTDLRIDAGFIPTMKYS
jgi:NAD(P)-dependent dehydrogenase (short-subunit alcohol dehydrogenase family)